MDQCFIWKGRTFTMFFVKVRQSTTLPGQHVCRAKKLRVFESAFQKCKRSPLNTVHNGAESPDLPPFDQATLEPHIAPHFSAMSAPVKRIPSPLNTVFASEFALRACSCVQLLHSRCTTRSRVVLSMRTMMA